MESLVNQYITAYMDGGWKLSGKITSMSGNMIIVNHSKKEYVVFKDKVSFMQIGVAEREELESQKYEEDGPENTSDEAGYQHYGDMPFSLPSSLLNSDYSDDESDFSVNFGSSNNGSKLSFKLKGEEDDNENR